MRSQTSDRAAQFYKSQSSKLSKVATRAVELSFSLDQIVKEAKQETKDESKEETKGETKEETKEETTEVNIIQNNTDS